MKKMIYVCSPCRPVSHDCTAQKIEMARNMAIAKLGCLMVVERGAIPIAPHVYFREFLNDNIQEERAAGMEMGLDILGMCDEIWVFKNGPVSVGMMKEIKEAADMEIPIRIINLGESFCRLEEAEPDDPDGEQEEETENNPERDEENDKERDGSDGDGGEADDFEDELPDEAIEAAIDALFGFLAEKEKKDGHGHAGHPNVKSFRIVEI